MCPIKSKKQERQIHRDCRQNFHKLDNLIVRSLCKIFSVYDRKKHQPLPEISECLKLGNKRFMDKLISRHHFKPVDYDVTIFYRASVCLFVCP